MGVVRRFNTLLRVTGICYQALTTAGVLFSWMTTRKWKGRWCVVLMWEFVSVKLYVDTLKAENIMFSILVNSKNKELYRFNTVTKICQALRWYITNFLILVRKIKYLLPLPFFSEDKFFCILTRCFSLKVESYSVLTDVRYDKFCCTHQLFPFLAEKYGYNTSSSLV